MVSYARAILSYLVKTASKATFPFGAIVPFFVNYAEGQVLVWRSADEADKTGVLLSSRCERLSSFAPILPLDTIRWSLCFVYQIRVKYVKFIALNDLGWRIVVVIVRLIVLIPFVSHLNTVEVPGLSWAIFVSPLRLRYRGHFFFTRKDFFVVLDAPSNLSFIQSLRGR